MNPFDFVNAINGTKNDLMKDQHAEKEYNSYLVNKSLSYFTDTLMYANEMNLHRDLDAKLQFHFFLNSIRPAKRYAKWVKKQEDNELDVVMDFYKISREKAQVILSLLSSEQITIIKQKLEKGG